MKPTVLLVEDDLRLRAMIADYLGRHGIRTQTAGTASSALRAIERGGIDLVVLDLMLPDGDGMEVCRSIRQGPAQTPVIILSAKGDEVDRIIGLEVGADDYLGKPCNMRELVARIFSVLRRAGQSSSRTNPEQSLRFGPFEIDLSTRTLRRQGVPIRLTSGEYQLLSVLIRHRRRVLNRDELMTLATGRRPVGLSRSIDIQISRLRQIIEESTTEPRYIQTVWGRGYVFVPDEEPA
jgi:two-component system phosphate regulon response regulator OmpR